jgi:hypothetical protein
MLACVVPICLTLRKKNSVYENAVFIDSRTENLRGNIRVTHARIVLHCLDFVTCLPFLLPCELVFVKVHYVFSISFVLVHKLHLN